MKRFIASLLWLLAATSSALAASGLPDWFPVTGLFSLNPDQLTNETLGRDEFKLASGAGDDYKSVEVTGHHWATSLYPFGPESGWKWDGEAAWNKLLAQLEKQGFKVVYLHHAAGEGVEATLLKGNAQQGTYVAVNLTKEDAYSNSVAIVEMAAATRMLTLTPPAATSEKFGERDDFPYLKAVAGAKLLGTTTDGGPLDVTLSTDHEPHLVGSDTLTKLYEGPAGMSVLDLVSTYANALAAAGWTIVQRSDAAGSGQVIAHFTKNGRDLWTRIYKESDLRWDIKVADIGSGVLAIERQCRVALYGVNFDFDKATLRADADPVLQQVLAALKADVSLTVEVGGHTDNIGKADHNAQLSQARADSVKAWLVSHGIVAQRLSTRGYGDTMPLVPNSSDLNRAKNRRVELRKTTCS